MDSASDRLLSVAWGYTFRSPELAFPLQIMPEYKPHKTKHFSRDKMLRRYIINLNLTGAFIEIVSFTKFDFNNLLI